MLSAPPRNALDLLRRPELMERMRSGLGRQIVLIEAPAGFAKTETMAASFRAALNAKRRCYWLSLSPSMTAADLAGELSHAVGADDPSPHGFLRAIAADDELIELYLDDVQPDNDPAALQWLIDRTPDNLRIAIAGRRLPSLKLSRLRQRGLVRHIGPRELAFTRGETTQILRHWLTAEELETAISTFAGWPALVRLAGLELESGPQTPTRNALIEGRARVFEEFLAENVMPSLDQVSFDILRAGCGLASFTPHIIAELSNTGSDRDILRHIETLTPLVLPDEQKAGWYRLNPVVATFLDEAPGQEDPQGRRLRHERASRLFAEQGSLEKAVLHASLAGNQQLIVQTIEAAGGVDLFLRAGFSVLRAILNAVPHEIVAATPSLRLCRCVMLAKSGRISEARAAVDRLILDTAEQRDPRWTAPLGHISSLISVYEDQGLGPDGIARLSALAHAEVQENTWKLGWIYNHLTIAHSRACQLDEALQCAQRGLAAYQEERATYPQIFMYIHLAHIHCRAGRIDKALEHINQARAMISARHWDDRNLQALANAVLARLRYLQGAVREACLLLETSLPLMARGEGWVDVYADGYATLALARMALDGQASASEALSGGDEVADARNLGRLRLWLSIQRAWLLLRAGQGDVAQSIAQRWPGLHDAGMWPTVREWRAARLMLARLHLRHGHEVEALRALRVLCDEVREAGDNAVLVPASLLLAEAASRQHDTALAFKALEEAAALSLPGAVVQPYHDEGRDLADEIRRLVRRAGISGLSRQAIEYLSCVAPKPVRKGDVAMLISQREAQILALLAEGLPNKAIAREIGVSEPTVKFHLKNLYGKLGVGRRTLAVAAARNLGLLA